MGEIAIAALIAITALLYVALRRVPKEKPRVAKKEPLPSKPVRRPRRSKEEIEADKARQLKEKDLWAKQKSAEWRERAVAAGISHYRWVSSGDERVCVHCKANHGKVFSWHERPETGHPGEGLCCPWEGGCRCTASPVFDWELE